MYLPNEIWAKIIYYLDDITQLAQVNKQLYDVCTSEYIRMKHNGKKYVISLLNQLSKQTQFEICKYLNSNLGINYGNYENPFPTQGFCYDCDKEVALTPLYMYNGARSELYLEIGSILEYEIDLHSLSTECQLCDKIVCENHRILILRNETVGHSHSQQILKMVDSRLEEESLNIVTICYHCLSKYQPTCQNCDQGFPMKKTKTKLDFVWECYNCMRLLCYTCIKGKDKYEHEYCYDCDLADCSKCGSQTSLIDSNYEICEDCLELAGWYHKGLDRVCKVCNPEYYYECEKHKD